ncbi:MAG: DUF2800 domain-containing protein [Armatimonadia bacterium]
MKISLQPSAAHRWLNCTASPRFLAEHEAELPKRDTEYSTEGTLAHDVAEKMLLGQPWSCDPVMVEHVTGYVERVKANLATAREGATLHVETKVPLFYMADRNGRIDTTVMDKVDICLIVRDLKYGEGVMVEAENNEQQAIYAESFIRDQWPDMPADGLVRIVIDQPRARDGVTIKDWVLTRSELGLFCSRIGAVARKIIADEDTQFAPGSACRFCEAKGICPARGNQALAVLPEETTMQLGGLPPPEGLTEDQMRRIVEAKGQLVDWLDSVEAHVFARLTEGKEFPGFKLVEGRSNRQWADEAEAAKKLRRFIAKEALWSAPKFLTPAQAEKALKKPLRPVTPRLEKALVRLIVKPEGKPVLAPESDPRPAICQNPLEGLVDESLL